MTARFQGSRYRSRSRRALPRLRCPRLRAGEHEIEEHRMVDGEPTGRIQQRQQVVPRVVGFLDLLLVAIEEVEALVEQRPDQPGLVTEELVQRTGRGTGCLGDATSPHRRRTVLLEQLQSLDEQSVSDVFRAYSGPGHGRTRYAAPSGFETPFRNNVSTQTGRPAPIDTATTSLTLQSTARFIVVV